MTAIIAEAGIWLVQQVPATLPETLYTRTISEPRSTFETVTSIASGLMSLALLVLTVALVPAAWNFRRSYKRINQLLDRVYGDVNPILRHVSTIADNVDYVTTSIRVDVQQVNQTIAAANQRLNHAVALTEQRLNDFNALLRVVQQEAEDTFVSTAAALRGVRAGADTFHDLAAERDAAPDHDQELTDGDHDTTGTDRWRPAPRIRPRPHGGDTA